MDYERHLSLLTCFMSLRKPTYFRTPDHYWKSESTPPSPIPSMTSYSGRFLRSLVVIGNPRVHPLPHPYTYAIGLWKIPSGFTHIYILPIYNIYNIIYTLEIRINMWEIWRNTRRWHHIREDFRDLWSLLEIREYPLPPIHGPWDFEKFRAAPPLCRWRYIENMKKYVENMKK